MAIIPSLPVTLTNGTTADATQVMANFNSIVTAVNSNAAGGGINTNITQLTALATPITAAQGGTGLSTLSANGVLLGEGTNSVNVVTPGSAGTVLTSNGTGEDPSYQTLSSAWPVGSLYFNTTATNPATLLGFGTWAAYAAGQVIIGVGSFTDGSSNSETITAGQQIGEYKHLLSVTEMPSHTHTDSGHIHTVNYSNNSGYAAGGPLFPSNSVSGQVGTNSGNANLQNTGGGASHNNIQPSIGVYIWQRTA